MANFIAIIPARGGSKGLPGKNLLDLHGHPLIAWSILFARVTGVFNRIIVSTDSNPISDVSIKYNAEVPFMRQSILASDTSATSDVVLDVINRCGLDSSDVIVLLEPTSPYRDLGDFKSLYSLFLTNSAEKLMSVTESACASYIFQYVRSENETTLSPIMSESSFASIRRQEIPSTYHLDGTFYASTVDAFLKNPGFLDASTKTIVSNPLSSLEVDTKFDLDLYRAIFSYFGPPPWYPKSDNLVY